MKMINLYEAKTHLSKLVAQVETSGERIVLCRNGIPAADLVAHEKPPPDVQPSAKLTGARFLGDPCAPLDATDWPEALR